MGKTAGQQFGAWGEQLACDYLVLNGYEILDRNVRTPYGEIDIIAREKKLVDESQTLVFVEVKARRTNTYGYPEDAITESKRKHLIEAAEYYLQENPELAEAWRIDVISIRKMKKTKEPEILHFKNAVGEL